MLPDSASWTWEAGTPVAAEHLGRTCVRLRDTTSLFAGPRTTIRSPGARTAELAFGFGDRVAVCLGGRLLYRGDAATSYGTTASWAVSATSTGST